MTDPYYVLNRNDGESVLHNNPREECNTDDALDAVRIDAMTGAALEASGDIILCAHCFGTEGTSP